MMVMQDKAMMTFAETDNVIDRTKREAENAKKFAIQALQSFAKGLLDVADNLGRASSTMKDRLTEIDVTEDPTGALPLLKTLLEGVDMTEKQLVVVNRVFSTIGV